jgi:hypothetical protein
MILAHPREARAHVAREAAIEPAKTRVSPTTFMPTFRAERINYWMLADDTARR